MIELIGQDGKNNTVYHTQQLLQCFLLSFARIVCTCCRKIERNQYFVARAERFARRWPFFTAVTVSGGDYCFALLSCMWRWTFHTQKYGVSVFLRDNLIRIFYCPQKYEVSVSVCENLIPSLHCSLGGRVYILHAAI